MFILDQRPLQYFDLETEAKFAVYLIVVERHVHILIDAVPFWETGELSAAACLFYSSPGP